MKRRANCCNTIDVRRYPVTGPLIREHQILEDNLEVLRDETKAGSFDAGVEFAAWYRDEFSGKHYSKEEILFFDLARSLDERERVLPHLVREHREEMVLVDKLYQACTTESPFMAQNVADAVKTLILELGDHAHEENADVFPTAEETERFSPTYVKWLHGKWKQIGFVR